MSPLPQRLCDLVDDRVRRDLRETVRMNLALAGVVVTDPQLDGLVAAVVARLDGELRVRGTTRPGAAPSHRGD